MSSDFHFDKIRMEERIKVLTQEKLFLQKNVADHNSKLEQSITQSQNIQKYNKNMREELKTIENKIENQSSLLLQQTWDLKKNYEKIKSGLEIENMTLEVLMEKEIEEVKRNFQEEIALQESQSFELKNVMEKQIIIIIRQN